jgi:ribosomal protein L12E/L44/L45/RPP1/RPP2
MSHVQAATVADTPTEAATKPAEHEDDDEEEGESVAGIGGLFG